MTYSRKSLDNALKNQQRRISDKINALREHSSRVSMIRLAVFLLGSILVFWAAMSEKPTWTIILLTLFLAGFITLVVIHRRYDDALEKLSAWNEIRSAHRARMSIDWENIPGSPIKENYETHPYARDFNIVGKHSLLQLIDTSIYTEGYRLLADWFLRNDPEPGKIKKRQQLVRELKPMAHFRDRLQLYATLAQSHQSDKDWDMNTLIRWLGQTGNKSYWRSLMLLTGLAGLNFVLGILFLAGYIPAYFIISFVIYLVAYNMNSDKVKGLFNDAYQIDKLLSRLRVILIYLETYPYRENSELKQFTRLYHDADSSPSRYLKKISRIAMAASSQKNELFWALLNSLVPWDLYFAHTLNRYKGELKDNLSNWLDRFYRLEALCSLANFAWLNPDYRLSAPKEEASPPFKAEGLGHPLIPHHEKVTNDITIESKNSLLLVTGSNMSGKSTFLRTLGINLCLCFAGGPVNAKSFETIPFRLFSSINITDSLDRGLSHFYAEVKRLRRLLTELNRPHDYPLFYTIDEIFRGTNNRERLIGSTAFLKSVANEEGIGVISTHDLELASLEDEISQLSNYHFEETIEDGKMRFEYKLKPGPCPTTNALKIMEMEGLPVE